MGRRRQSQLLLRSRQSHPLRDCLEMWPKTFWLLPLRNPPSKQKMTSRKRDRCSLPSAKRRRRKNPRPRFALLEDFSAFRGFDLLCFFLFYFIFNATQKKVETKNLFDGDDDPLFSTASKPAASNLDKLKASITIDPRALAPGAAPPAVKQPVTAAPSFEQPSELLGLSFCLENQLNNLFFLFFFHFHSS